ncbi:MAG: hypothetical protein ABII12_10790 [Planctomycetota bacterium]
MSLEAELAFFKAHRLEWLADHEGRFALIKGTEFLFFDSDEEAYRAGIERWGDTAMLIKRVLSEDIVEDSPALLYGLLNAPV